MKLRQRTTRPAALTPAACRPRSMARTTKCSGPSGTWSAPSPSTVTSKPESVVSTTISSQRLNARPRLSKPGPRLALDADTTELATRPAGSIWVTDRLSRRACDHHPAHLVATRRARLRRACDLHRAHLVATRRARLRRACDLHRAHLVATRRARLRRACDRHTAQLVATRRVRLRRACDLHYASPNFSTTRTGSTGSGDTFGISFSAVSGSLSPLPVTVHTTVEPGATQPSSTALSRPAMLAADAGSTKMPSERATRWYAARISSSVAARNRPLDCCCASTAAVQDAGAPIRIAVAIVSGWLTGLPSTRGAAPAAWVPNIRGSLSITPSW